MIVKQQYYYLVSSLPKLILDIGKKSISMVDFINFCSEEMKDKDFNDLKKLFLFSDIKNAINFKNEGFSYITPSYYTEEEFKENLKDTDTFLPFLSEYFYNKKNEKRLYPELMEIDEMVFLFYTYLNEFSDGFVNDYFLFEFDLQNITTALSLRMNDLPISNKIIPYGEYFEQIKKNNSSDFGLFNTIDYIENLVDVYKSKDLIKIEKAIENIRWKWLDEKMGYDYFSSLVIFVYTIKLSSVERWLSMDEKKGEEMLNNLINEISANIKFSEEFTRR